jgi:hypothetical protein
VSGPNPAPDVSVDPLTRSVDITGGPSTVTVSAKGELSGALTLGKGVSLASDGSVTAPGPALVEHVNGDQVVVTVYATFQAHAGGEGPLLSLQEVATSVAAFAFSQAKSVVVECEPDPVLCLADG